MPITGLAIAAGVSLAKDRFIDQPAADRKRKLAAETQRYSPWTHLTADPVSDPNYGGDAITAGMTGALVGQGVKNSNAQNAYLESKSGGIDGVSEATPTMSAGMKFDDPYASQIGKAQPMMGASAMPADEPSWKFTGPLNNNMSPEDALAQKLAMRDPYASLKASGLSGDAISQGWTVHPYAGN